MILAASAVAASHTGNTTETTLATVALPGNTLGANGVLRITTQWSFSGANGNREPRVYFGGTLFMGQTNMLSSTQLAFRDQVQIHNRNATNSQVGDRVSTNIATAGGWGSTTQAVTTAAVDTTANQDILITGKLANGGDTITLEAYVIEYFAQA